MLSQNIAPVGSLKHFFFSQENLGEGIGGYDHSSFEKPRDVNTLFQELIDYAIKPDLNEADQQCIEGCYAMHSITPTHLVTPTPLLEENCIKAKNGTCYKCYIDCLPTKLQCAYGCAFQHFEKFNATEHKKCKEETTGDCYRCMDECETSRAVTVTSFTVLFSVVIASLVI